MALHACANGEEDADFGNDDPGGEDWEVVVECVGALRRGKRRFSEKFL